MQSNPDSPDEVKLMKLLGKIQTHEAQSRLLSETIKSNELLNSKILSSIQPKVGRNFVYNDLENKKQKLLENLRKELILLAIKEKEIELQTLNEEFSTKKQKYIERIDNTNDFLTRLEKSSAKQTFKLNSKMNKKVSFHLQRHNESIKFTKTKTQKIQKKKKRKISALQKKKNRIKYKNKQKQKKQEKIQLMVDKIKKDNIVVNLSNLEIPNAAYIFLAKGLGFVPSKKVDIQDLKYDTMEFIRKLEWKAFFKANPELQTNNNTSDKLHEDIKVSSFTHPPFNHPLLEEIKMKLLGWITYHKSENPKSNLTPLELRGRKWLMNCIKGETLLITKADKGGATLIMNYMDVQKTIEDELLNITKFTKLERNLDDQLEHVKNRVKTVVMDLEKMNIITSNDKMLITGLTSKDRPRLAPEYQPEPPYAYPLFKIHKLSNEDILHKIIPPSRLVHASKFGPLYRLEKWCSPYLTTISRDFCKNEFILDTRDLIESFEKVNESQILRNENINLITLDVEKLYPSIQPDLALIAINDSLTLDKTTNRKIKTAIAEFINLSFEASYVSYKSECFSSNIGIPTGGSLSRQIADIFLHWITFEKANPKISEIQAIRFWKRFIDDCIGIWRGTRRSFDNFVNHLNNETIKYGIKFPIKEIQFGKSVHFLDLTVSLDEENRIQYCGYKKPTDAKHYLNPKSFHPNAVFRSIPFSQMLRTLNNNSKEETKIAELNQLVKEFEDSGYNPGELSDIKQKAIEKVSNHTHGEAKENSLVFSLYYFEGLPEFKLVIRHLENDIKQLIGDNQITFAIKKGCSIGNMVIRNKSLGEINTFTNDQKCKSQGCLQCPLVNTDKKVSVNNNIVTIPHNLNCKKRNVIYLWKCKLCGAEECYFGRTTQKCHLRTNGHRNCFNDENWERSALSMHAKDVHQMNFSLDTFTISIVKKVSPQRIRREEFKYIDKYRTNFLGLNRYKS